MGTKNLIYICSPYRPRADNEKERAIELEQNLKVARDACTLAAYRGHIPVAPHLYFPQFLDDNKPIERYCGTNMGLELLGSCTELWIITPRISEGMSAEIKAARKKNIPVLIFTSRGRFEKYTGDGEPTDNTFNVLSD